MANRFSGNSLTRFGGGAAVSAKTPTVETQGDRVDDASYPLLTDVHSHQEDDRSL